MKSKHTLLSHLQIEYEDRSRRLAGSDLYSWFNEANLYTLQQRQKAILKALKRHGMQDLSRLNILEMGCGNGGVLKEFLGFGASPRNLYGVDLLGDRLAAAQSALPGCHFVHADGRSLPFPARSFDLVLQFTALSSVLDLSLRESICRNMRRVLKPGGLLLSYDFWLNPTNSQTRGLRPREIRQVFQGCQIEFQRITLAPPISRRLVGVSWLVCELLEKLQVFNTHYLVLIQNG